ncbi:type 2 lanthipeptide synthetase LanM [Streptosporangium sp. NPDC048865]|uniref:type 2 lanthipeptide synthetase LanM n=1 Tax=Streptosporangium sp. NPDC048865 TaxID=3155766 RepID=UPI0034223C90
MIEKICAHRASRTWGPISVKLYGARYDRIPFGGLMAKFADHYQALLRSKAAAFESVLTREAWDSLAANLIGDLVSVSHRTLILELNAARAGGRLAGDTPEDRYRHYSDHLLSDPSYLSSLFEKYPVLGPVLVRCAGNWLTNSVELLSRLAADLPLLRRHGWVPEGAVACLLRSGLGDPHNDGRSVTEVTFLGGTRVIYKPRPLDAEELYDQAVTLLNDLNGEIGLRAMRVVNRGSYGWCEFIGHDPAPDPGGIGRFYRRIGSCAALLTCLAASDIHMENLRAAGEFPIPIDLETVLQPSPASAAGVDSAAGRAFELLSGSVLATAMVPGRQLALETSAIGGGLGGSGRLRRLALVAPFTDVMRTGLVPATLEKTENLPFLDHERVDPSAHVPDIVGGFLDAYDAIAANKPAFRELVRRFSDIEIRYLTRPTEVYGMLLGELQHPRHLRGTPETERLWPELAEAERIQLLAGDIPRFFTRASSTSLHFGEDGEIGGFFRETGREAAERRLRMFGEEDRAAQLDILTTALSTLPHSSPSPVRVPDRRGGLRDSTREAIDALADEAILGKSDCTWIGLAGDSVSAEPRTYGALPTRLYDGLSGMALMFGYAAKVYADERYLQLALRSIRPVLSELRDERRAGAYSGMAGTFYVLGHLAALTADETYIDIIDRSVPSFVGIMGERQEPGLVSGLAGAAVVACDLYERHGLSELKAAIALGAERLTGSSWDDAGDGFAHGRAGVGWALLRAGRVLKDTGIEEAGLRALAPGRDVATPEPHWCRGAAGTGISRLLAHRLRPSPAFVEEVAAALPAVTAKGPSTGHGLCHGELGGLEFLRLAAEHLPRLGREPYRRMRRDLVAGGTVVAHARGSRFPGLLTGRAGACLSLLGLVAPGEVPSVLCLEGPQQEMKG